MNIKRVKTYGALLEGSFRFNVPFYCLPFFLSLDKSTADSVLLLSSVLCILYTGCEVVRQLWAYIKSNELQNPAKKSEILPDGKMKKVFGKEPFTVCFYLSPYIHLVCTHMYFYLSPYTQGVWSRSRYNCIYLQLFFELYYLHIRIFSICIYVFPFISMYKTCFDRSSSQYISIYLYIYTHVYMYVHMHTLVRMVMCVCVLVLVRARVRVRVCARVDGFAFGCGCGRVFFSFRSVPGHD